MNRVVLAGRITRDPELRNSPSGVPFCSFSIAVNRAFTGTNGERDADFINCVAFNKQAENLTRFIKKGAMIGVDGKLQSRTYQAQDGSNRTAITVVCDGITFLESKSSNQNNDYQGRNTQDNYSESYQQTYQKPVGQSDEYQNRSQSNYGSFQQPTYQAPNPNYQQPKQDQPKSSFDEVKNQFGISDDDLPF